MATHRSPTTEPAERELVVRRIFNAPAEVVFDAWLNPASVGRWLFATPGGEMIRVEVDARVGGEFTIVEKRAEVLAEHFGTYLEIDRPRRLVFSFASGREQKVNPSHVTVEIKTVAGGCEVTLTHRIGEEWAEYFDRVREGWTRILEGLAANLGGVLEKPGSRMTLTLLSDIEAVLTRVFDAPREVVFEAFTKPAHLVHWWGRRGSTLPVCEVDLRPGGAWRFVERGADGEDSPFKGVYREIVPPERLVYTFIYDVEPYSTCEILETVTFTEQDGKTTVTSASLFPSVEVRDWMIANGMEQGAAESYDRLAEHLASKAKTGEATAMSDRDLVITRVFDAPRELVFRAWTEPERLMRWWAPKGFTTPFCKVDLRSGGVFHFCMRSPDGRDIWGIGRYREIVAPERIVYIDSFADAEGNPVPPAHYGMSAGHPLETVVAVTFAEQDGKTKLTLRHSIPESVEEREGTQQGWTEMLDGLAEELAAWGEDAA